MELLQSTIKRVPVVLADSAGNPKTGIAFGAVTCYIQKQDGAAAVKAITVTDWFEIDAVNMPGHYDLKLAAADVNTLGFLRVSVAVPGTTGFSGLFLVRQNTTDDLATVIAHSLFNRRVLEGRWKIDSVTNKLTIFSNDGTTILQQFDLKDSLGNPTATAIFERVPNTGTYPIP